jgi:hypothetical protein
LKHAAHLLWPQLQVVKHLLPLLIQIGGKPLMQRTLAAAAS